MGNSFNCNDNVRVKLTKFGEEILRKYRLRMTQQYGSNAPKFFKTEDGFYIFKMIDLIEIFGVYLQDGKRMHPNPFSGKIQREEGGEIHKIGIRLTDFGEVILKKYELDPELNSEGYHVINDIIDLIKFFGSDITFDYNGPLPFEENIIIL